MSVVDVVRRGARQEVQNIVDFVTTPVGPFATIDKVVVTGRNTARGVASAVGVKAPSLRGQFGLGTIRSRLQRFRRY